MGSENEICQGSWLSKLKEGKVREEHKEETKQAGVVGETGKQEHTPNPVFLHLNNLLCHLFSNVEVYINNHRNETIVVCKRTSFSKKIMGANKCVSHCEMHHYEKRPNEIKNGPVTEPFFTERTKLLSKPVSFVLFSKLYIEFLYFSHELILNIGENDQ